MIKNNKQLITDWDFLYMKFNEVFNVDIFEKDCADEWPLINLLDSMKDDTEVYESIVSFFYENYACIWHNNILGGRKDVEPESPEWYEGYDEYKKQIMSLATYFKMQNIENKLNN